MWLRASRGPRLAFVALALTFGMAPFAAAADVTIAKVRAGTPGSSRLYVMFTTPAPAPADVRGGSRWQVQVETPAGLAAAAVVDAQEVPDDYAVTGLVVLTLANPLPPDYRRVEVRYTQGNAPLGVLTPPATPTSGIVPVDDPKKADVYLSGIALIVADGKPLYTIDARGTYELWASASGARVWDVGGSAKADKRENADLDSYVVGANYHDIARRSRSFNIHWFSGAEMNSKAQVTNLVTAPRLVLPWTRNVFRRDADGTTRLSTTVGLTLEGAIEAGWNLRNSHIDSAAAGEDGSGGLLRGVPGVTLYVVRPDAGFLNRLGVTARYAVRLLARDELFLETRKSRGAGADPVPQMNRRARHFTQVAAAFMLTDFAGIELKYTYGSEPPAFKLADHNGSIGLVIKFRQTDRVR